MVKYLLDKSKLLSDYITEAVFDLDMTRNRSAFSSSGIGVNIVPLSVPFQITSRSD